MTTTSAPSLAQTFGLVLLMHRRRLGLSQGRLAEMCGIPRHVITSLERGRRAPNLEEVEKVAQQIGVGWLELLGQVEEERKRDEAGQAGP